MAKKAAKKTATKAKSSAKKAVTKTKSTAKKAATKSKAAASKAAASSRKVAQKVVDQKKGTNTVKTEKSKDGRKGMTLKIPKSVEGMSWFRKK